MPHKFLPSSRHVFLDLQNILLFGGLDDTHSDMEPFFTNYCYKLSLVNRSFNEQLYVCHSRSAMTYSRGDFAICHNNGFVFIFGGSVNVSHNQSPFTVSCEKYDIQEDEWYVIADMPIPLRNSTACSVSADSIYIFGGETVDQIDLKLESKIVPKKSQVILQYVVAANIWL